MIKRNAAVMACVVAAIGIGVYFGWSSIATLSVTTFIVSLLPCVAMCTLGACAERMGSKASAQSNDVTRKEIS